MEDLNHLELDLMVEQVVQVEGVVLAVLQADPQEQETHLLLVHLKVFLVE
tara:strand:+ start:148 stop:297 length:150 start_codon:yes stop_codon:yes gene_type:complete